MFRSLTSTWLIDGTVGFSLFASALLCWVPSAFAAPELSGTTEGKATLASWQGAGYQFTPPVKQAFLAAAKARALADLSSAGKSLPADFLAWVDGDPIVQGTVYGARPNAANILLMLRSLEIDLGPEIVRKDYTQLALAMAVVHAAKGPEANLAPRERLKLVISGDPRQLVNTTAPNRPLDLNDHIINFLNTNTLEEEVVVGQKEELPPLRYDAKGVAIPPAKNAKPVKVPIKEMRTRTLYAADVMASKAWQEKFNAYMKEKGQTVSIDCGDKVIFWKSTSAVGAESKNISAAFKLFRAAYEEKGLLPKARDPFPSPAECMAYLIRNDRYIFPEATKALRNWPRYPLNGPWPTLTLLAADNQPLREREERWIAFRDAGTIRTYGEYTGGIAQQGEMQSARRLKPFAFSYGTYQMMGKDGGVCGTMANIGMRTYTSLGIPACTAGQPGHCALIRFGFDAKKGGYECIGEQFATGGPRSTSPHVPWVFGGVDKNMPMIYYMTVAWGVNHGLQSYLDSCLAYQFFNQIPAQDKIDHGTTLLESAIALNPYNLLITDAALAGIPSATDQVRVWNAFKSAIGKTGKPGCPQDEIHIETVRNKLFAQLAKLPVPADKSDAIQIMALLRAESCRNAQTMVVYQCALDGVTATVRQTSDSFAKHLQSARTDKDCIYMADTLNAVAGQIADKKLRDQWALARWQELQGHETYLEKTTVRTDTSMTALAKLAGQKPDAESKRLQPLLNTLGRDFQKHVAGVRTPATCNQFAGTIGSVARQIKDPVQSRAWIEGLGGVIRGKESYTLPNKKQQADPSAAVIAKLLQPVAAK
ncbi:MAG: hypothetical protein ABIT37_22945 [Luteolibacter sp.]